MTAASEQEIWEAFRELASHLPMMRKGQLIAAVDELCQDIHGQGLWEISDEQLAETIHRFQQNYLEAAAAASSVQ